MRKTGNSKSVVALAATGTFELMMRNGLQPRENSTRIWFILIADLGHASQCALLEITSGSHVASLVRRDR